MRPLLSKKEHGRQWLTNFRETIGGTEIGGIIKLPGVSKLGWQATLEKAVEGLCDHQSDSIILLLFDELPYMLQKIAAVPDVERKNLALTMLKSLGQDHYLLCDTQKRYTFRFPLIQGWWKLAPGLEA